MKNRIILSVVLLLIIGIGIVSQIRTKNITTDTISPASPSTTSPVPEASATSTEPILIIYHRDPDALKKVSVALEPLGADVKTLSYFYPASDSYVHDANSVYWIFAKAHKIEGADPKSFFVLSEYGNIIARDRSHVYITSNVVPNADPTTFVAVGVPNGPNNGYFKDNRAVFYKEIVTTLGDYNYKLREVPGADPQTIRTFDNLPTNILAADDKNVYLRGEPVAGIDGRTFTLVANPYFTDKQNTYFFNWSNNGGLHLLASTSSIRVLTNDYLSGGYLITGDQVVFGTTTITLADASTFHLLDSEIRERGTLLNRGPCTGYCFYTADANAVYYKAQKIADADPKTFDLVGYGLLKGLGKDTSNAQPEYGSDATHVYYLGEELSGADPKTFTPIISGGYYYEYGKDDFYVYWKSKRIEHADPKTFKPLGGQQPYEGCRAGRYGVDATSAYYQNIRIDGADIKTFRSLNGDGSYAEDALHFYKDSQPADKKEFRDCEYG